MFRFDSQTLNTLRLYQCQPKKDVGILSSLHPDVNVSRNENPKTKSDSIL